MSHKLLKHMDWHSCIGEYRSWRLNSPSTVTSMEQRERKGPLGDDLSSFHRDTCVSSVAVTLLLRIPLFVF